MARRAASSSASRRFGAKRRLLLGEVAAPRTRAGRRAHDVAHVHEGGLALRGPCFRSEQVAPADDLGEAADPVRGHQRRGSRAATCAAGA